MEPPNPLQIRRVTRSKNEAQAAYNRLSGIYDWLAGSSETPLMMLGLEMLAAGAGDSILEIGSGTGNALLELANKVGESGIVHGVDLSPGMLQQASERLLHEGTSGRVILVEADGALLPYSSESFSAIFMSFTLELFDTPEIPLVLAECRRVLKPGGRLGVVAMHKTEPPGRVVRLYEWFHDHFPAYADCRPIDSLVLLEAAGFSMVKHEAKSMWGLPVELTVAKK